MNCNDQVGQSAIRTAREGIYSLTANVSEQLEFIEHIAKLTIENLDRQRNFITSVQHFVQGATGIIETCDIKQRIDTDGTLVPLFEAGENVFRATVALMEVKRKSAFEDRHLRGEDSTRVIQAYTSVIEALQRLNDACSDLRWAILDHDADLEPIETQTFSSAADMMRAVRGGRK